MGKTELIYFGTKRKLKNWTGYTIECDGQTIHAAPSVKYLGLTIDQYLNGDEMASGIIKKINSRLKLLYTQANFLDQNIKKILCSALVLCLFDFQFLHGIVVSLPRWENHCKLLKTKSSGSF